MIVRRQVLILNIQQYNPHVLIINLKQFHKSPFKSLLTSNRKMSVYPRLCKCCQVPVTLKHKQAYNYHIKKSKASQNISREENKNIEMANKKAKIDFGSNEKNWLYSKMDLFKKAVVKSHGATDMLETQISLLEDGMNDEDPDLSKKVSDLCFQELDKWGGKKVQHQPETNTIAELKVNTLALKLISYIHFFNHRKKPFNTMTLAVPKRKSGLRTYDVSYLQ